ncbi:SpaA isopeptide-forming pilin-related protein [Pseudogracilibacillus auburnensis]|uniref:LPXTG-motif cell wall-anchored protein/fimbrial isopeptide formation D2 family protein n=1 Tax=Pseudogracilibacillus auburnensis TaxID=1494959 RepID=A0A2V3VTL4_9BACI|nr:LPXTG cell wall anchor domain-containing protein [Pseudogracilibacillus auburnensis]PXW83345.1 LPXTG-motif cell wall-anchored protein/fimbrial isopeptide formation D2 family protein [Pseudogracilibacillus auburnensis]
MQIVKKRSYNLLLVFTLLLSVFVPTTAFAYDVIGDENNPKLTIHKYEQESDDGQVDGTGHAGQTPEGTPLASVEFTLTQTHAYNADTDEWTEVAGTPFTRVTDANGQIVIENIDLGRYKIQETDGPAHVNLHTEEYSVDIPMTNQTGSELNYDVHIYPKNEIIRGAVELLKLDGETGSALPGVVFELYKANDDLVQGDLVTDPDGYIRISGLEYGDYYFKEISAPNDYVIIGDKIPFSITESGTVQPDGTKEGTVETITIENFRAPHIEKTVNNSTEPHETNRETEFTYNLKIALPEDIAEYEEFIVTDNLDERLAYTGTWTVDGVDASIFTFAENGQTLTWTVNDFAALDGIPFVTINFTAEIKAGVEVAPIPNDANIDFTNNTGTNGKKTPEPAIVIPTEGSLSIVKQDGNTAERLAGATFELHDLDGNVVVSGTTDTNGELVWTGLDYGDYKLVETKAPEGYRILKNPIDITIDKENSDITLTVDNFENGWELPTTGGIGTILFTFIGLTVMGLSAYLYIRRKKVTA